MATRTDPLRDDVIDPVRGLRPQISPGSSFGPLRFILLCNHVIGPLGSGVIRHRLLKDSEAPLVSSTNLSRGRRMISRLSLPVTPIRSDDELLILTQSNMHVSNFGVDETGKTVLFDFGQIGGLPLLFAKFTMSSQVIHCRCRQVLALVPQFQPYV
jgi:hypothetical protein